MSKLKVFSGTLILFFALGIIMGCSTSGSYKMRDSIEGKTIKGAVVGLTVVPPNPDALSIAIQLRGLVATQLLGAGLFKTISDSSDKNADYDISIKLTNLREVSGVSRVMWGAMAGPNSVGGEVTVNDIKTGQTVRSFSFEGESASHPFSGKSDIKDAISRAAEEIINGLSK